MIRSLMVIWASYLIWQQSAYLLGGLVFALSCARVALFSGATTAAEVIERQGPAMLNIAVAIGRLAAAAVAAWFLAKVW